MFILEFYNKLNEQFPSFLNIFENQITKEKSDENLKKLIANRFASSQ